MGVKDLWPFLAPFCERKPMYELQGKIVAIDLAGWVCESLNVVDYFVHPRQYLKNLFFRTCYMLMEGVIPVFVLEGVAPKLKENVIAKRNEIQFRGVKPKNQSTLASQDQPITKKPKGRTRFNHVLKQCETLLNCMGIQCVQGPGEAEAYCAFLNKNGLVDGVISQDSDCFAYGALKVYRNFSISTQGSAAAQGGAVDVYDMLKICNKIDFGQQKIIIMALLCGCDYSDGIAGVGKDSVFKFFNKYKNDEIMNRIKCWRENDYKYTELEMKVDNKNICSYCGHLGKTVTHTKSGCSSCKSSKGCDESLWKEERLSIKAELILRKKALCNPEFPSQEIIDEFLWQPSNIPILNLNWKQPNLVKFLQQIGKLLQWQEIYCFQKFLPLLTRWQVNNIEPSQFTGYVLPESILKKRTLRGTPSYEIIWKDSKNIFVGLIPDEQIQTYIDENPKGIQSLWSTIEPSDLVATKYPHLVESFLKSIEKPKKTTTKERKKKIVNPSNDSLNNMKDLIEATEEISKAVKKRIPKKLKQRKGIQLIDKFFVNHNIESKSNQNCSTPKTKLTLSDLEMDDDENDCNLSEIIQGIISGSKLSPLKVHNGKKLIYETLKNNLILNESKDDLALLPKKRNLSSSFLFYQSPKRFSLSNSLKTKFNLNTKHKSIDNIILIDSDDENGPIVLNHVDRFLAGISNNFNTPNKINNDHNVSYFFGENNGNDDEFEKSLDISFLKNDFKEKKENFGDSIEWY